MGLLIEGQWRVDGRFPTDASGRFLHRETQLRNWVTPDGAPGPSGAGGFAAEPGRYHLYVSYACPWAHGALIAHKLKGLGELVPVSVLHWLLGQDGWAFARGPRLTEDEANRCTFLREIYVRADPGYTGRVSLPVLWDKKRQTIVSNDGGDIMRMFNRAFDRLGASPDDYYPEDLRGEIDALEQRIHGAVANGVYRCGFATTQRAYDEASRMLFGALDEFDARLGSRRFLLGERPTEADWRLFVTLIRFDIVYFGLFKCNLRRVADYPNLRRYLEELRGLPGVEETIDLVHIKRHYYESLRALNPSGVVPAGLG